MYEYEQLISLIRKWKSHSTDQDNRAFLKVFFFRDEWSMSAMTDKYMYDLYCIEF